MRKALVMPALLCGLIAVAPQRATAATDPLFKCASSKIKAASKKEAGKFNCLSKDAGQAGSDGTQRMPRESGFEVRTRVRQGRLERRVHGSARRCREHD